MGEDILKQLPNAVFHPEDISKNPYFSKFYKDPATWAMIFQFSMLNTRFEVHLEIERSKTGLHFQDRCEEEDAVFMGTLTQDGHVTRIDYDTYMRHLKNMKSVLSKPDAVIYLDTDVDTCMKNIKERGNQDELTGISREYLQKLHDNYEILVDDLEKRGWKIIKVGWKNFGATQDVIKLLQEVEFDHQKSRMEEAVKKEMERIQTISDEFNSLLLQEKETLLIEETITKLDAIRKKLPVITPC